MTQAPRNVTASVLVGCPVSYGSRISCEIFESSIPLALTCMNRHVRTNTAKLHHKRFVQFIRMAVFRDLDPAIRRTQALKDYLRLNLSPI
ncbi:MAG: hypothetical protein EF813_12530, partial [Methanosarcinales archaeon]